MERVAKFLRREPWVIAFVVSVGLFGIYSAVEYVRANNYQESVAEFRRDSVTKSALASLDQIQRDAASGGSQMCDLSTNDLLNEAAEYKSAELLHRLNSNILELEVPEFYSAGIYMGSVIDARDTHGELIRARNSMLNLSYDTLTLKYCQTFASILVDTWFLRELSTPEGVDVLLPNQLENYQIRFGKATQAFRLIDRVPAELADVHKALNTNFVDINESLQSNTSNVEQFSSSIQLQIEAIEQTLQQLESSAVTVKNLPDELVKASIPLRP